MEPLPSLLKSSNGDFVMMEQLKENLAGIHARIAQAAIRSGRRPDDVMLIGVTKYVDAETTLALVDAGCCELGESRPQMLWEKSKTLSSNPIHWHMIGHVQRNKVKRTIECCDLIHSVDSHRLIRAIDDASRQLGTVTRILLEVNVSGESSKQGLTPTEMPQTIELASELDHIAVCGLMAMAGLKGDLNQARREFASLRDLRSELATDCPRDVCLKELSMGMSRDFEVAIEEGATMVRVGSLLFEGV